MAFSTRQKKLDCGIINQQQQLKKKDDEKTINQTKKAHLPRSGAGIDRTHSLLGLAHFMLVYNIVTKLYCYWTRTTIDSSNVIQSNSDGFSQKEYFVSE